MVGDGVQEITNTLLRMENRRIFLVPTGKVTICGSRYLAGLLFAVRLERRKQSHSTQ